MDTVYTITEVKSVKTTIYVSTVYTLNFENLKIPEGWKPVDFRPPRKGEDFFNIRMYPELAGADYKTTDPRIILERVPPARVYPSDLAVIKTFQAADIYGAGPIVLPAGYTFVKFAFPVLGELYLDTDTKHTIHVSEDTWYKFSVPRIIVKKT